jgi:hypothetical protein
LTRIAALGSSPAQDPKTFGDYARRDLPPSAGLPPPW